jgi:hypothetical protein
MDYQIGKELIITIYDFGIIRGRFTEINGNSGTIEILEVISKCYECTTITEKTVKVTPEDIYEVKEVEEYYTSFGL